MKSITDKILSYIPRLRPRKNSPPKRKNHVTLNIANTPPKRHKSSLPLKKIPPRRLYNSSLNNTLKRLSSVGTRSPGKSPKSVRQSPRKSPKSARQSPRKLARIPPPNLKYLTPQQINNLTWGPAGINL